MVDAESTSKKKERDELFPIKQSDKPIMEYE